MINEKISYAKDIINPSIIFLSLPNQENEAFIAKILALMNYPLNTIYQTESLKVYDAIPNNHSLYYSISLSLNSDLAESLDILKPYLQNDLNIICIVISTQNSSYQSYLISALAAISRKACLYITYSNRVFAQRLFSKETVHFISFDNPKIFLSLIFQPNNYLFRPKIFTTEKTKRDQRTISNNTQKQLNISSEEDNDNDQSSFVNHIGENSNSKNSLISISKEVYKFIRNKSLIQGNDVTKHIIDLLSRSGQQVKYKNIQRRVYDAINVMCAIGLLTKDRGKISFNKEDSSQSKLTNSSSQCILSSKEDLNQRISQLSESIKEKQSLLIEQCSESLFYKKFIQLNQTDHRRNNTLDKLDFPFHIITLNSESEYNIKEDDFNHRVVILSNKPFQLLYPEDLIKFFIQSDFNANNIQHFFSKEIVKYIIDNKLIENCFSIDKEEMPIMSSSNNNNNCYSSKREKRNSFCFNPRMFEPISILDSESNFNMYTNMEMRKGSEDNVFNTFMQMKNDELFDGNGNENLEKNYSNYLSHSYYSKH